MKIPILSVVIPTHNRSGLLARAIDSALLSATDSSAEVIVVPNGPGESWKLIAKSYRTNPQVRWHPISTKGSNAARNCGLALARGKYVRFLDDDDYLYEDAQRQCILLDESDFDASQGGIDWVDDDGAIFYVQRPRITSDFLTAILVPDIFTLVHSILWRRTAIAKRRWDVNRKIGQDVAFAFEIARDMEVSTHQCELQVGAWIHHTGERTSRKAGYNAHAEIQANILLDVIRGLEERSALTIQRRKCISEALWNLIHSHFPLSPIFWTNVARKNLAYSPNSRPNAPLFNQFPSKFIHPLTLEWLFTPHRFVRHQVRNHLKNDARPADLR